MLFLYLCDINKTKKNKIRGTQGLKLHVTEVKNISIT